MKNSIDFVGERNAAAGIALGARRDALLTVHRLNLPSTLNTTLLNTNIIENTIRNWREATHNVKLWSEKEEMIPRWTASGLLWAEAGYRKVRGYQDLPKLKEALAQPGATRPRPRQTDASLIAPADCRADAEKNQHCKNNPTLNNHLNQLPPVLTISGTSPSSAVP